MRGMVAMFVLGAAMMASSAMMTSEASAASARSRPATKFCLRGPTGGIACRYNTLEQCRMAASGTGGSCMRNPRYGR